MKHIDTKNWNNFLKNLPWDKILFAIILLIAAFERMWMFREVPGGIHQDEAFAGYNAWSLLKEGMDASGDHFPVYFEAWGDGQNALNTYLMMPFIAVLGLKTWVIRLPQLLIGLLTLPTVYGIIRRLWNTQAALFTMFLTAIIPWHIMMSRWGLESNLAPGFVTFGLYFFLRGLEKRRYLIVSGIMYGLSLYCYAVIWPFVPLIILLEAVYCLYMKKLSLSKELFIGGGNLLHYGIAACAVPADQYGHPAGGTDHIFLDSQDGSSADQQGCIVSYWRESRSFLEYCYQTI